MGAVDEPALLQRHRVTVDEYYRMAEVGVLQPDARVELIEGEVIDMAAMNSRHAGTTSRLIRLLERAVGDAAVVTCQVPLRLSNRSEPQPDFLLLPPRDDFYTRSHPTAADVWLLIEVADSSAGYDRQIKVPLYARHGVQEVWIIDLEQRQVRFFRQPSGDQYLDITATETPGLTPVQALPGITVDLSSVLP